MKQNWFRASAPGIRPPGQEVFTGAQGGRLIGDTGLSLREGAGPPHFEDLWEGGGTLPAKVRRLIEAEPEFTGLEVVLGLMESRDGHAVPEISMLARAGEHLVALLAIDSACGDAHLIETRLADVALRAQRFCASAAILVLHSATADEHAPFNHYAAMAAAHGVPSARRNVLHLVDSASRIPVFAAWIDAA